MEGSLWLQRTLCALRDARLSSSSLSICSSLHGVIVALYLLFFAWWYVTAYGFGDDPAEYEYIMGFPEWFFYSCIAGYVGISLILWGAVRLFFKDLPLDDADESEDESNG